MIATCVCGWQTVCEPGDEHGPVTRLLEHREIEHVRVSIVPPRGWAAMRGHIRPECPECGLHGLTKPFKGFTRCSYCNAHFEAVAS